MGRRRHFLKVESSARTCILLMQVFMPLAFAATPPAPTSLTVAQLDQLLGRLQRESDAKAARELAGVNLTERANAVWLAKWEANLKGDRTRKALLAVADASAFLEPPAKELPSIPPPGPVAQQQIIARSTEYVKQALPRLPDFLALRTTTSFEFASAGDLNWQGSLSEMFKTRRKEPVPYETLGPAKESGSSTPQLFLTGSFAEQVAYRGGFEVPDSLAGGSTRADPSDSRLTTVGEFGPVLQLFLTDASSSTLAWDRWEQGVAGPLAVFRYSVSAERSHFEVDFPNGESEFPAYHGEVGIDPANGSIWRITIVTSSTGTKTIRESSMLVEFARTEIGGAGYVCPVRGVAMVRYFDRPDNANTLRALLSFQTSINDVSFTKYHLFRSESRVVSEASKP